MPLKKPSDFFNKKPVFNDVDSLKVKISEEKFNNIFDIFKNYKNYLDDFEDKLNNLNSLSEQIVLLKNELQKTIKKEDLDNSIFAQLLYVNEAISNIENSVKTINDEKLNEIREDTEFLLKKVENFIDTDIPKYKKNIIDFELNTEKRINDLIGEKVSPINDTISLIKDNVSIIKNNVEEQIIDIGKKTLDLQKVKNEVFESIQSIENSITEENHTNSVELQENKIRYGFSAQEVLSLEGEDSIIVDDSNPEHLGLTHEYMIPILVNAVKELDTENQELKQRLIALENYVGISSS